MKKYEGESLAAAIFREQYENVVEDIAIQLHTFERTLLRVVYDASPVNCSWESLADSWKDLYKLNAAQILDIEVETSTKAKTRTIRELISQEISELAPKEEGK